MPPTKTDHETDRRGILTPVGKAIIGITMAVVSLLATAVTTQVFSAVSELRRELGQLSREAATTREQILPRMEAADAKLGMMAEDLRDIREATGDHVRRSEFDARIAPLEARVSRLESR